MDSYLCPHAHANALHQTPACHTSHAPHPAIPPTPTHHHTFHPATPHGTGAAMMQQVALGDRMDAALAGLYVVAEDDAVKTRTHIPLPVDAFSGRLDAMVAVGARQEPHAAANGCVALFVRMCCCGSMTDGQPRIPPILCLQEGHMGMPKLHVTSQITCYTLLILQPCDVCEVMIVTLVSRRNCQERGHLEGRRERQGVGVRGQVEGRRERAGVAVRGQVEGRRVRQGVGVSGQVEGRMERAVVAVRGQVEGRRGWEWELGGR
eukprot:350662-Chlamydomonas_euryale.AAC.3